MVSVCAATHAREGERVVTPRLRHPHGVVPETLGVLRELDDIPRRGVAPQYPNTTPSFIALASVPLAIVGRGPYLPGPWTSR